MSSEPVFIQGNVPQRRRGDPNAKNPRGNLDTDSSYQLFNYVVPAGSEFPNDQRVEVSGDHLFITDYWSSLPIWIKFGNQRNPWLRVRAGETYRRKFSQIWIRSGWRRLGANSDTSRAGLNGMRYVVSVGPMVDRQPQTYGFRRGFVIGGGNAPLGIPAAALLYTFIQNTSGVGTQLGRGLQSWGRTGGMLRVTNLDSANWVNLKYQSSTALNGTFTDWFPIQPGQTLDFPLDESLFAQFNHPEGFQGTEGLYVAATTNTGGVPGAAVTFRFILSTNDQDFSWNDTTATQGSNQIPFTEAG